MITGEGGFVHRMMPPVDWDCGPIPAGLAGLTIREIADKLRPVYLAEERVKRLADSYYPNELRRARWALEMLVEEDALTIFAATM